MKWKNDEKKQLQKSGKCNVMRVQIWAELCSCRRTKIRYYYTLFASAAGVLDSTKHVPQDVSSIANIFEWIETRGGGKESRTPLSTIYAQLFSVALFVRRVRRLVRLSPLIRFSLNEPRLLRNACCVAVVLVHLINKIAGLFSTMRFHLVRFLWIIPAT